MPEPVNIKLARLEEKLDAVAEKIDNLVKCNSDTQARLREMENKTNLYGTYFKIIALVGSAIWTIILLIIGKIFGKWFGQ
ncbi:MAG TPA: hypothetical protein VHY08_20730 [Bacillota bacterium]|nr:hypothetical protein [Bacillota bacterium]